MHLRFGHGVARRARSFLPENFTPAKPGKKIKICACAHAHTHTLTLLDFFPRLPPSPLPAEKRSNQLLGWSSGPPMGMKGSPPRPPPKSCRVEGKGRVGWGLGGGVGAVMQ
jgi:hypothetical protein